MVTTVFWGTVNIKAIMVPMVPMGTKRAPGSRVDDAGSASLLLECPRTLAARMPLGARSSKGSGRAARTNRGLLLDDALAWARTASDHGPRLASWSAWW